MKYSSVFLLLFLLISPLSAQTSAELVLDGVIGSPLQGKLQWLDESRLLVGTSAETFLYEPERSLEPVYTIPAGGDYLVMDDELILDGQRWDIQTGELLGENRIIQFWRNDANTLQVNLLDDGSAEVVGETLYQLPTPEGYSLSRVIFSPDSVNAALVFRKTIGSYEEILQLWNLQSFEKIGDLGNTSGLELVGQVLFFQEGQRLLVNYTTEAVYGGVFLQTAIWDAATGQHLNESYAAFTELRISADGQFAALMDGFEIEIWATTRLGTLSHSSQCEDCGYRNINFNFDGSQLVALHERGFTIWDVSQLAEGIFPSEPLVQINDESHNYSYGLKVSFSPDAQTVLRWGNNIGVEIWDISTKQQIAHLPVETWVQELQFSPDGNWLKLSIIGALQIFDTETWTLSQTFPATASLNPSWTNSTYWSDGNIILYSAETQNTQTLPVIEDTLGAVMALNADAELVLFLENNEIYSLRDNKVVAQFPQGQFITLSEDSAYLLAHYSDNGEAFNVLYSLENNELQEIGNLQLSSRPFGQSIISDDGRTISGLGGACGDGGGGNQAVWQGQSNEEIPVMYIGGTCGPYAHVFSPDGKILISAWDSVLVGLDITQEEIAVDERGIYIPNAWYADNTNRSSSSLSVSADSEYMAWTAEICEPNPDGCIYGSRTDILKIDSSPATMEEFAELRFSIPNASYAIFSPDSQFVLTNLGVWSIDGIEIFAMPNQLGAFDPAGRWLVSYDGTQLLLWDWAQVQTGVVEPIHQIEIEGVNRLAFNADGSYFYAQRQGDVQRLRIQSETN